MVNCCASFGTTLSVVSVILLLFASIGQLRPSILLSDLRLVSLSTEGLATAINAKLPSAGVTNATLYYSGSGAISAGEHQGLMRGYEFGFWGYCATASGVVGSSRAYCSQQALANKFQPFQALWMDLPAGMEGSVNVTVGTSVFTADNYLGNYSQAANYVLVAGCILAFLAMLFSIFHKRFFLFASAMFSLLAAFCLTIGLATYCILFARVMSALQDADIGVSLAWGNALWIGLAATACVFLAVLPYVVACCIGRQSTSTNKKEEEHLSYQAQAAYGHGNGSPASSRSSLALGDGKKRVH